jgi:hypothetical protein
MMTVLERKAHFVADILNDADDNRFIEMELFYSGLKNRTSEPCMYTVEEIRAGLPQRIKALEDGQGIPHEQIRRKPL